MSYYTTTVLYWDTEWCPFYSCFLIAEVCDKEVPLCMRVYTICSLHTEENVCIRSCKMCCERVWCLCDVCCPTKYIYIYIIWWCVGGASLITTTSVHRALYVRSCWTIETVRCIDYFHVVHSPAVNHDPVNSFGAARRGWLTVAIFEMLQHLHTGHQQIHVYVLLCKVSFGGRGIWRFPQFRGLW